MDFGPKFVEEVRNDHPEIRDLNPRNASLFCISYIIAFRGGSFGCVRDTVFELQLISQQCAKSRIKTHTQLS